MLCVVWIVNVRCVLGNPAYTMLCLNGQMTAYSIFMDGVIFYTVHLASVAWVFNSPTGDLVSSGETCLGPATNNIAEYHVVIGLLTEALDSDAS